jgi:hypothetical protein
MTLNNPSPKGGYQAILEIVNILGEEDGQSIEELVPQLTHFGYKIEEDDNGVRRSKALSPGGHTYLELTELLSFAKPSGSSDDPLETELTLTEETTNHFNMDTSGERIYDLLQSDQLSEQAKRGAISALILSKLSEYTIDTQTRHIPNAFREFLSKVWEQQDESTGRYQTSWRKDNTYFKDIYTDPDTAEDWNEEKLRHCATRAIDLGVCRRSEKSGRSDLIYPVLVEDIFQGCLFFLNQYYRKEIADSTPNIREFYEKLNEWYPISKKFFELNVLYDGILNENTKITAENYPILHDLLNQYKDESKNYQIRWFEGEDSWDENVRFAEFEIEVM